jgi:hypothetical protein
MGWNNTRTTAAATKMKWNNLQVDKAGGIVGMLGLISFSRLRLGEARVQIREQ